MTPSKHSPNYHKHLAGLRYPDGMRYWCLSFEDMPRRLDPATTEMVCLATEFFYIHAAVNINTGRILEQVKKQPIRGKQIRGRKKTSPAG